MILGRVVFENRGSVEGRVKSECQEVPIGSRRGIGAQNGACARKILHQPRAILRKRAAREKESQPDGLPGKIMQRDGVAELIGKVVSQQWMNLTARANRICWGGIAGFRAGLLLAVAVDGLGGSNFRPV